jgi:hypothetical protein
VPSPFLGNGVNPHRLSASAGPHREPIRATYDADIGGMPRGVAGVIMHAEHSSSHSGRGGSARSSAAAVARRPEVGVARKTTDTVGEFTSAVNRSENGGNRVSSEGATHGLRGPGRIRSICPFPAPHAGVPAWEIDIDCGKRDPGPELAAQDAGAHGVGKDDHRAGGLAMQDGQDDEIAAALDRLLAGGIASGTPRSSSRVAASCTSSPARTVRT